MCFPLHARRHRMSIKDWPKSERPRERLIQQGAESLSDTELLAILLITGSSSQGLSAMDCARLLLERYSTYREMARISHGELVMNPGIGPGKACRVQATLEIARRMARQKMERGRTFQGSRDVFHAYSMGLRDKPQEIFIVVLLDSKNRCVKEEKISLGSLNCSVVHPREVFRLAVRESAASLILVHNHPSGDPAPSQEDVRLTERLVEVGNLLGIQILDHIIIGEGRYYSFCDQRRLAKADPSIEGK